MRAWHVSWWEVDNFWTDEQWNLMVMNLADSLEQQDVEPESPGARLSLRAAFEMERGAGRLEKVYGDQSG